VNCQTGQPIKADDLKYNHLSKGWIVFLNILNKFKITAALGLIAKSLEKFLCFVLNKGEHQFITPKKFVEKEEEK
jgi:hypothetical protein